MTQPAPPMISVLHDHGHCVGFLRSAGPRGFTAYNADGLPIGIFQDKAAAVEAITAASPVQSPNNGPAGKSGGHTAWFFREFL
jgi:hypothetical protein